MVSRIFVIRDKKVGVFNQPYFVQNDVLAKRSLLMAMMKQDIQIFNFAEDFELVELGNYNDENGKITLKEFPEHVCELVELKNMIIKDMRKEVIESARIPQKEKGEKENG